MNAPRISWAKRLAFGPLWALVCFLGAWPLAAQPVITNVTVVNVTPSAFSVVASVSPAVSPTNIASIAVFSKSDGTGNLAGQVGVEYYPLNTGDPTVTNAYSNLLSQAALQQDSMNLGLVYARISYCAPNTTYYFQITVTNTNGQSTVWPASGPLPAATTAQQNSFVLQSQELLVTLNDAQPPGSIITLTASNSSSVLAAVVGDGANSNQAFFNLNDLIAAAGGTNYSPVGPETFTASVVSTASFGLTQTYGLVFSNYFSVGQSSTVSLGALASTISIGSTALLTGTSSSVPISVASQGPLVNLSFILNFPPNMFTAISLQPTSGALQSASLSMLTTNSVQLSFATGAGLNLEGSQQIAKLNFTAASNQSSAFVPIIPQSPLGANSNAAISVSFSVQQGRAVVIGPQPLLDTQFSNGLASVILYGIPGNSYQIQSSPTLAQPGNWANYSRVPLTNLEEIVSTLNPIQTAEFFRAYQFTATNPIVDAGKTANGQELLVLYGTPGQAYEFDYSTDLSAPWTVLKLVPMTNSFAFVNGVPGARPGVYYRYFQLNADPPIVQASLAGTNRVLLAYGLVGTNYALQSSATLATNGWSQALTYSLSNSFQFFTNPSPGAAAAFYRIKKQ